MNAHLAHRDETGPTPPFTGWRRTLGPGGCWRATAQ